MDPSLSMSNDPHHPPQFTPFTQYSTANHFVSGAGSAPNHPLFSGQNPYNHHVFQPQPQQQIPPPTQQSMHPSFTQPPPPPTHPPYTEMICAAIAALNEPDGSSKMAISRYMERCHTGLSPSHAALLTHHLKYLKTTGVLSLVKKSYKFAASSAPPESVAVAAAAAAAGLEAPRSEILPPTHTVNEPMSGSASQPLKRGRGRPPKPKPEAPINFQRNQVQSNGQPIWEQQQVQSPVVAKPIGEASTPMSPVTVSAKRGPGRPRKNGSAAPIVQATVMAGIMKRRGRPPGRRAAGRQRKPKSVSATASVFPYVANGARRRGRPRRVVDPSSSTVVVAPEGGESAVAVAPGMKRGRGRPPKIGGVITRLMKPIRGRGRPVGRPRKYPTSVTAGAQDSGEHKKKLEILQEKIKEIVNVLKAGVTSDNQEVMQAIQDLEALTEKETVEPQAMEVVQPEETAAPQTEVQTEAAETQGGEEKGEEREGGEAQTQAQTQTEGQAEAQTQTQTEAQTETQTQTEAEAMQEALF